MTMTHIKVCYKPLWKLLIDRDITKPQLRKMTQIAPSTFSKMNNDEIVSLDVLGRISLALNVGLDDIVEVSEEK